GVAFAREHVATPTQVGATLLTEAGRGARRLRHRLQLLEPEQAREEVLPAAAVERHERAGLVLRGDGRREQDIAGREHPGHGLVERRYLAVVEDDTPPVRPEEFE